MAVDARVYELEVCPDCLTQPDAVTRSIGRCVQCDSRKHPTKIRFRVDRSQVLKQADPRASLIERTIYFGCVDRAGHYHWGRGPHGRPYSIGRDDSLTPWGFKVDGGLLPKGRGIDYAQGVAHVVHEQGWTALVFTDRSVDTRPGSWSVYLIPAVLDGPEALAVAREAFPSIFARYQFPVTLA